MFYLPFKFQELKEYTTPRGPNFKWGWPMNFTVNGNKIRLRAPFNRASGPFGPRGLHGPRPDYNLDGLYLSSIRSRDSTWGVLPIILKAWDFYGPWFTGKLARLDFSLNVIAPRDIKEDSSYFHPRTFESAIADFLTYQYGHDIFKDRQNWFAPVNWQPIESLPCIAARCEVAPNKRINGSDIKYHAFFPITDQHLIVLSFIMGRKRIYIGSERQDREISVNRAPVEELIANILNSIELTLTPETKELQRKAVEGLDDTSVTKSFLPLQWAGNTNDLKLL
ncbi:hypothetical protein MNBD_GAMMA10-1848 [hydrothermal vent metagenome]|uniref:Uncharacterized protein n=1 Tax=hydrothermal vent metagenome TaxID=652676 RepID=A0A3B0X4T0_9ZZZZ